MVRHSLNYVSWKRRKIGCGGSAPHLPGRHRRGGRLRLGEFEAKWDSHVLPIGQSWRRNWSRLTPFFDYPAEIRKVIYTTNAIESVNMGLRKLSKNRARSQRRGADQAVLPGPAQHQPEVDHAHSGLEGCVDPLYQSIRRPHLRQLKSKPFTQKFGHAQRHRVWAEHHLAAWLSNGRSGATPKNAWNFGGTTLLQTAIASMMAVVKKRVPQQDLNSITDGVWQVTTLESEDWALILQAEAMNLFFPHRGEIQE